MTIGINAGPAIDERESWEAPTLVRLDAADARGGRHGGHHDGHHDGYDGGPRNGFPDEPWIS